MLQIQQFRNKIRTHGLPQTLRYTADFLSAPLRRKLWTEPVLKSYSQKGEDLIIDQMLGHRKNGRYLDIGAYDPQILSNTKRFYDRGWRGCNIEPNPSRFEKFLRDRPGDINLNLGLSSSAGNLTFYDFVPETYATFSEIRAQELQAAGAKLQQEMIVPVITMIDLFEQHLGGTPVDFCTLDTEGLDLIVLKSNDWNKFRPRVFCVEVSLTQSHPEGDLATESIEEFLIAVGYQKQSETVQFGVPLNGIYLDQK